LVPALDKSAPTTFSKKIITELLREGMGFKGLIVSDALDMGALTGLYSPKEIAVRAVEAGIDILLHPHDTPLTIEAVVEAVEQGRLTHQRIKESVARIMHAKTMLGLFDKDKAAHGRADYAKHREVSAEIGRKTFRFAQGNKDVLPVKAGSSIACFVLDDDNNRESANALIKAMQSRFKNVSLLIGTPDRAMPQSLARDSINAAELVFIAVLSKISASKGRSGISKELRDMATEILKACKAQNIKSVVISFDSPYILEQFKDADLSIAAYGRMDEIQAAASELLTGAVPLADQKGLC
jgi:beta-glucosidase-like glycosyl hydrolase